jgi:hypothetical protein
MTYFITAAADYIRPWLFAETPVPGYVHSVYRGAVNLVFDYHFAALQPEASPMSPITLAAGFPLEDLNVAANTPVQIGEGKVRFEGGPVIEAAPETATVPTLMRRTPLSFSAMAARIKAVFDACTDPGMGFYPLFAEPCESRDLITSAMKTTLKDAETAFRRGKWEPFAETLTGLAGLGQGLTPSGDDFLCGMFAGFNSAGGLKGSHPAKAALIAASDAMCRRTHPLSAAFITCAAEGYVSQTVRALLGGPEQGFDVNAMAEKIQAIGHSSGIDTLCGIMFAYYLLTPALKKI